MVAPVTSKERSPTGAELLAYGITVGVLPKDCDLLPYEWSAVFRKQIKAAWELRSAVETESERLREAGFQKTRRPLPDDDYPEWKTEAPLFDPTVQCPCGWQGRVSEMSYGPIVDERYCMKCARVFKLQPAPERTCGNEWNTDVKAKCTLPAGHLDDHGDGRYTWTAGPTSVCPKCHWDFKDHGPNGECVPLLPCGHHNRSLCGPECASPRPAPRDDLDDADDDALEAHLGDRSNGPGGQHG